MKPLTALTTLAVITVAWFGITMMSTDCPGGDCEDPTHTQSPTTNIDPDLPDDPDRDDHTPDRSTVADSGSLEISAALSHDKIKPKRDHELFAEVALQADSEMPASRAPINVALVVDVSGSMRGDPMVQARRAARTFVDALEPSDRISLVSFDHQSTVEVPSIRVDEEGRTLLHEAIDGLHAGGTTNISGGLRDGFEQVERHSDPEMVDRVVLMTDGMPNVGITSLEGLAAKTADIRYSGVTVSTMGFGTHYDAELMSAMATEGAGNFRHVSDAADLELAFSDEIADLQATVASGIEIDLLPADGVTIDEVYGFSRDNIRGGERIEIGNLEADARRSAIVGLRVDAERADVDDLQDALDVEVRYVDRLADRPVDEAIALDVGITEDTAEFMSARNSGVMARVEEQRSLVAIREAADRFSAGDRAGAQQRIHEERRRFERVQQDYELDDDSPPMQRVGRMLDSKEDTVQNVQPNTPAARDRAADFEGTKIELMQGR